MKPARTLAGALAEGSLVLDGGLSDQLRAQGTDLSDELWSARLLDDGPEQIEAAHAAYVRAGAQVLITASYQATYEGFARRGVGRDRASRLLADSVALARRAGAEVARGIWVAASVGPYGAMLADGGEYRGRYGLSVRELERFHRPRIETLAAAGPDVLALETVPDTDEAEALLRAARGCGVPVWLSYTVAGDRTRAGQPLDEAFALAAGEDGVIAVGVNCCDPSDADTSIALAASTTGKPVVVYPNNGGRWDEESKGWAGEGRGEGALPPASPFTTDRLRAWQTSGARLLGGCCSVGPSGIAEVAALLAAEKDGH
ncbi:homocysteine S-methyltransferase [Streptomyces sp. NPDC058653]|uniref:homocysteine S-methyltransferase n=1 Tax=Streptomyces sp. NPDC058653 TaxID=3346576 RepID=UPI00365816E0